MTSLVSSCLDLYPSKEIQEEIKKVYKLDLIDPFFIGSLEDIEEKIREGEEVALTRLKNDHYYTLITNIIEEMEWWSCFTPPELKKLKFHPVREISMPQFFVPNAPEKEIKIGRNEPCPCGSGKKYKKCCLR